MARRIEPRVFLWCARRRWVRPTPGQRIWAGSKVVEASKTAAAIFGLAGRPDLFARMEKVAARTRTIANSNETRNVQLLTAISIVARCLPEALGNREAVVAFLRSVDILS